MYCVHLLFISFIQEQYDFVHDAVCDFAMSGGTYIDAVEFGSVLAKLKEGSGKNGYTAIEEQFQVSLVMCLWVHNSWLG